MALVIKAKNMKLSSETRDYIEKKTEKFDRFLSVIDETRIDVSREQTKNSQDRMVIEITMRAHRKILRAEERSGDIMVGVDAAVDKIYRQIARLKGKQLNRWHDHKSIRTEALPISDEEMEILAEENEREIVRVKQFSVVPMNEAEAIEQMQLLAHDFFVFYNADVGRMNVLYKREDNNYGLLDPVVA